MLKLTVWYFGHQMWRTDSLEKTLMLGKIEGRRKKGTTEDEMVGWHHWLNGYEFEQAPGVGDGQGRLACCSPWGHKESDTTEQLNWTESCWDNSINQAVCDQPRCMLYKHQSHLVCFPRHFTLTPVLTRVTFCIVAKFCNKLPASGGQGQVWVFSFFLPVSFSDCLIPPDEGSNSTWVSKFLSLISRLGREYTILSPSWPDDGVFWRKIMPEQSFLLAKSLSGPFLQSNHHMTCALSLPIFCAYPPPPSHLYVCLAGEGGGGREGRKRSCPWLSGSSQPSRPQPAVSIFVGPTLPSFSKNLVRSI